MEARKKSSSKTSGIPKKKSSKEPSATSILKKVGSVSDTNKALQKEIKSMTKIFSENQKVLISMKGMIDSLTGVLEYIQKQSKQLAVLEDDTQKLYSGLNQVKAQSNIIEKINFQTERLQDEVNKISEIQKNSKSVEISQQVEDSVNSIRNNSHMIIKIAQRIDEVRDELRTVSGKTNSISEINNEIENLKKHIEEIISKTSNLQVNSQIVDSLKNELEKITEGVSEKSDVTSELDAIKVAIDAISAKAIKIESLGLIIEGLKQQFNTVSEKASLDRKSSYDTIKELASKIDKIEENVTILNQKSESISIINEELKSVKSGFSDFKHDVIEKTSNIGDRISSVNETIKKQEETTNEIFKQTERLSSDIQEIRNVTNKASDDASKEMMALLKLSEYQSNIRMNSESKYGDAKILENMAIQTKDIMNLFEKISNETNQSIPLPNDVRQWAISKILDCADKWEVRFSDVFSVLSNVIGKDLLKESIRIEQVRDIYGIRAVDEIRNELNIS